MAKMLTLSHGLALAALKCRAEGLGYRTNVEHIRKLVAARWPRGARKQNTTTTPALLKRNRPLCSKLIKHMGYY